MIVDAVDKLPLDAGVRERGEAVLLDESTRLNATDLAKAAKHLVEVADPDKAERKAEKDLDRADRAAHHGRFLSIVEDGAGGVRLRGRGHRGGRRGPQGRPAPADQAAAGPRHHHPDAADPDCGQVTDPRDHGARLWDALVEVAQHALASDLPPDCHGARPRVAVTTSPRRAPGQDRLGHRGHPRRR